LTPLRRRRWLLERSVVGGTSAVPVGGRHVAVAHTKRVRELNVAGRDDPPTASTCGPEASTTTRASAETISSHTSPGRRGGDGRPRRNEDRQLALVFLWATVGSQLKQYCRRLDIPAGTEPFAGPIQMRDKLVYGSVLALDAEVVSDTCVLNGPELHELVTDLRSAL
jgi:hypothetical protein